MLGERISKLRGKRTQQEIADKLGISRARYSHYENERVEPDTEILKKMADVYNVSIDYLLGRTDKPNPLEDIAAHRTDDYMDDLPEEAINAIEEYKQFIREKYEKKRGNKKA